MLYSSDEDDTYRPMEALEAVQERANDDPSPCTSTQKSIGGRKSHGNTSGDDHQDRSAKRPCRDSTPCRPAPCRPCTPSPGSVKTTTSTSPDIVIQLNHEGSSPWHTDSHDSDSETALDTEEEAIKQLNNPPAGNTAPQWMQKVRPLSSLLLSDGTLVNWPEYDGRCVLAFKPGFTVDHWIKEIRSGDICVQYQNIMIFLERFRTLEIAAHLKNGVFSVCRAIRAKNTNCRIYIISAIPSVGPEAVLGYKVKVFNRLLLSQVTNINKKMRQVFYIDMEGHFITDGGQKLFPMKQYYNLDGTLTKMGCLLFRDCMFREAGLKRYWFNDESDSDDGNI